MQELGGKYAISDKFSLFHFPHFTFFCTFAPALDFPLWDRRAKPSHRVMVD